MFSLSSWFKVEFQASHPCTKHVRKGTCHLLRTPSRRCILFTSHWLTLSHAGYASLQVRQGKVVFPILVATCPTKYWEVYTSRSRKGVQREIKGKKISFLSQSSAQLAISSLKYLVFSLGLSRASRLEGGMKTP